MDGAPANGAMFTPADGATFIPCQDDMEVVELTTMDAKQLAMMDASQPSVSGSEDVVHDAATSVFASKEENLALARFEEARLRSEETSKEIGKRMLQGWILLGDVCPSCQETPLLRQRGKPMYCVACRQTVLTEAEASAMLSKRIPVAADQPAPSPPPNKNFSQTPWHALTPCDKKNDNISDSNGLRAMAVVEQAPQVIPASPGVTRQRTPSPPPLDDGKNGGRLGGARRGSGALGGAASGEKKTTASAERSAPIVTRRVIGNGDVAAAGGSRRFAEEGEGVRVRDRGSHPSGGRRSGVEDDGWRAPSPKRQAGTSANGAPMAIEVEGPVVVRGDANALLVVSEPRSTAAFQAMVSSTISTVGSRMEEVRSRIDSLPDMRVASGRDMDTMRQMLEVLSEMARTMKDLRGLQ